MKQIRTFIILLFIVSLIPGCVKDPDMSDDILNAFAPEVVTGDISATTATSVTIAGEVKRENGAPVFTFGFVWGLETPVTFENMEDSLRIPVNNLQFSAEIAGLIPDRQYYIAAFAENAKAKSLGATKEFFTKPEIFKTVASFEGEALQSRSAACFTINNRFAYYVGGDKGSAYTSTTWMFEPEAGWKERAPYPADMAWMTIVNYNNMAAFSLGGRDGNREPTNHFYKYSANNNIWETVPPAAVMPAPVAHASGCALLGQYIFYIGGLKRPAGTEIASAEVWRYDPEPVSTWSRCANLPKAQWNGFSFAVNNVIYTGFGDTGTVTSPERTNILWRSNNNASSWEEETTMPGNAITAAVVHQNQLYVVDDSYYIYRYDFTAKGWTPKSQLPLSNRSVHCMYSIGDLIYILGTNNTLISYDPRWDN